MISLENTMPLRLLLIVLLALITQTGVRADELPAPWAHGWIGQPNPVGNAWFEPAAGRFCMWASASDLWENRDNAYFTYRPIKGDFTLTARLHEGLSYVDGWAKGGLMLRNSLDADAPNAALLVTARQGIVRQFRGNPGQGTDTKPLTPPAERTIGTFLRLSRAGDVVRVAHSADGVTFSPDEVVQGVAMADEVLVGFAWATHDIGNPQILAFNEIKLDDTPVVVDDARRAQEAEARLRPKDNTRYPRLHTSGPMPARRAADFIDSIGLTTHIDHVRGGPGFHEIVKPALLHVGARYIRDGGYDPAYLEHIRELSKLGIRYTANLVPRGTMTAAEQVDAEVLPIVDTLVAVEGPNEPDIMPQFASYKGAGWPQGSQTYQRELYDAIKKHRDPRVRKLMVLSPPLAHPHVNGPILGRVPCDAVNVHMYQGGALPDDQWATKWYSGARHTDPEKPIVITETGYHYRPELAGQPGISERAGARYVPRLFLDLFNLGVVRTHYYNLSTDGWGDLRDDGTIRPSLLALKNLIELVGDNGKAAFEPKPLDVAIAGDTADLRTLLLQKSDGTHVLVLWLNRYSYDYEQRADLFPPPQKVTLRLAAPRKITSHRPLATTEPIYTWASASEIEVWVPDHPIVLKIAPR
jgi:regulation of enolase protein 1 (concanavalin A-like superfamily)